MINLVNTQRLRGLDVGERPKVGAVLEVGRRRRRLPNAHGPHLAAPRILCAYTCFCSHPLDATVRTFVKADERPREAGPGRRGAALRAGGYTRRGVGPGRRRRRRRGVAAVEQEVQPLRDRPDPHEAAPDARRVRLEHVVGREPAVPAQGGRLHGRRRRAVGGGRAPHERGTWRRARDFCLRRDSGAIADCSRMKEPAVIAETCWPVAARRNPLPEERTQAHSSTAHPQKS